MTLSDFLKIEGNSASALAKGIGCAVSSITRAANGDCLPTRTLMAQIYEHTGHLVEPNDFFDIESAAAAASDERATGVSRHDLRPDLHPREDAA